MAIWLIRTGLQGEHGQQFAQKKRVEAMWVDLDIDLLTPQYRCALTSAMTRLELGSPSLAITL